MGTYSGYAEFFPGYALSLEISLGAWSDPDAEHQELERLRAAGGSALAAARAPLAAAHAHFADGDHPYRRWLELLERGPRDYPGCGPEPLWASEARSRGARLPLERWAPPQDEDALLAGPELRGPLWVFLYLTHGQVPYPLREALDVQFVASQFAPGGLFAEAPTPPRSLREAARDAAEGLNRHTTWALLSAARAEPERVAELAADPRAAAIAPGLAAFLDPAAATLEAATRAARDRRGGLLCAALCPDAAWERVAPALAPCVA
ncbi:MAG: hypothetical protein R3F62_21880 [Planctomycetota bacterium]